MENKENKIEFSITMPIVSIDDYVIESCEKFKELKNNNFELIIFPDNDFKGREEMEKKLNARIIPTGKVSPADKRDASLIHARGRFIAFIDGDAYPSKNWLDVARRYLENDEVSAIGGPQLTPRNDSFWQKVSGAMFISPLSGGAGIRYWPGRKVREVEDWPSVNFIIKKEDFEKIGGFASEYWPGEDTKICLDIIKKLKKKILYVPDMIVFHHRRSGIISHLRQTGCYGLQRGFFFKEFPETSRKLSYFYYVPSLFVLFLFFGFISSFYSEFILKLYLWGLYIYSLAILFSTLITIKRVNSFRISFALIPYLVSFHVWYGIRFIQGLLFTEKIKDN